MSAKHKTSLPAACESPRVQFELAWAGAESVCIAGSFNDWHPGVSPMLRLSDGTWAKELPLAPGSYEYRFIVDGQWVNDPAAMELVPNPFGTLSAVLEVRALTPGPATRLWRAARADTPPTRTAENFSLWARATAWHGVVTSAAANEPLKSGGASNRRHNRKGKI